MIEKFREAYTSRFERAKQFKESGKKVIGWMCIYVPEEIFHAAGMLPIRVLGVPGKTMKADAYFSSNMCSFTRSCLQAAFDGQYDFLDGLVTGNNCDHVRRLFDVWHRYQNTSFLKVLSIPNKVSEESLSFYRSELVRLKRGLEDHFGLGEISSVALRDSIDLFDRMRRLLREIYRLRQGSPKLTGTEALEVVRAGMVMPKEEFVELLEELLGWLQDRQPVLEDCPRLLLTGSEMDDVDYVQMIEQLGAGVVADDLCNGSRYFWEEVGSEGDPWSALAQRYLNHTPCPRMQPSKRRFDHLREMIHTFDVGGVIMQYLKFCDFYCADFPLIKGALKDLDLPLLCLDREYATGGIGQMKTRVQAFLEVLDTTAV